jgi:VWFA-related protein
MKKIIFFLVFLLVALNLSPQVEQYEVTVTNIVVPIRVFDGNKFVGDLKIEDLEIFEDGIPQKIEALYLTKKSHIVRAEEFQRYAPKVSRNFFLIFQMTEYNPKLAEAFDYLFNEVLLPEDNLTILTPIKNYSLPKQALSNFSKEQLSKEMQSIVRKDTNVGASQYRSILRDLRRIVQAISGDSLMSGSDSGVGGEYSSLDLLFPRYRQALLDMEKLRVVDEKWFLGFAQQLKRLEGQKNVFFFYQREFRPEISQRVIDGLLQANQDKPNIQGDIQDLFQMYHRYSNLNADRIKQVFADSAMYFYFIFMNKKPQYVTGVHMREQSEDVFDTFKKVAEATGGLVDSSQNPAAGFRNAVAASEDCYILYYSPKDYKKDGKFKNIEVRVKNKDYKLTYRTGYLAK